MNEKWANELKGKERKGNRGNGMQDEQRTSEDKEKE